MTDSAKLFGKGIAFPPRVDELGRLAWSVGEDNIAQSIRILLSTGNGERVNRHGFGAGLGRFLFQPNTLETHTQISKAITDAIQKWEPRVNLESVEVSADAADPQSARAIVVYRLAATRALQRVSLTVPTSGQSLS